MIKKIRVKSSAQDEGQVVLVGQLDPSAAECIYRKDEIEGSGNKDGNLEIKSPAGKKLNLVADKESIQVKPGFDSDTDINSLQLDCEAGTIDCEEFPIKVCNGLKNKATRVVGTKLNTAELVLDTQKADTSNFDPQSFNIKFRYDKWNDGVETDGTGPIYAKLKARAIDLRCFDHGGIALQIAGKDGDGHENKIKFESSRQSDINDPAEYGVEGGKGLEFGTFNTQHTSLFTGDYRFNKDGKVYPVTRQTPVLVDDKFDYPTQADDFKDVVDSEKFATWEDIVSVTNALKNKDVYTKSEVDTKIANINLEGTGVNIEDLEESINTKVTELVGSELSEINNKLANAESKFTTIDAALSEVDSKIESAQNPAVDFLSGRIFRKDNGNLEVSAENLGKYATKGEPSTEIIPSPAVYFDSVEEYNIEKGTELTEEEFSALSDEEKIKTPEVIANPATLDLVSDDKVAIKCKELEFGAPQISWAVEISKKNKVTLGGNDYYPIGDPNLDTNYEEQNKGATYDQMKALFPSLGINIEKNNSVEAEISSLGTGFIGINILDLISLKDKITALENKVSELESTIETLKNE